MKQKSLVKFHTTRELCLPYEQNWSIYKQICYGNGKLAPFSWDTTPKQIGYDNILDVPPVYMEKEEVKEERQFVETDYVVMGPIGRKNWIETLWEKFVEVR